MAKKQKTIRSDDEIRSIVLRYFYDRNQLARSPRSDKTGAAAKISVVNRELKSSHGMSQNEIRRNLTYLLSEGWIDEDPVERTFRLPSGVAQTQVTAHYIITASGIDKVAGESEFTKPKLAGVNIEATGQNVITIGDNNVVDARFSGVASQLADLKAKVQGSSEIDDHSKVNLIADLGSMQEQLVRKQPDRPVLMILWDNVKGILQATSLAGSLASLGTALMPLLPQSA